MKKKNMGALALVLAGMMILTGCAGKTNEPVEAPINAFINNMFTVDDTLYTIRNTKNGYIKTEREDDPVWYQLTEKSGISDAVWHDAAGKLYYSEGYKIYTSDITGSNETVLWELPDGSSWDFACIETMSDNKLFVRCGYGEPWPGYIKYYYNYYYSVDVLTGDSVLVYNRIPTFKLPHVLCTYGDTVILLQMTRMNAERELEGDYEEPARVLSIDLVTGEMDVLGKFVAHEAFYDTRGIVMDDMIYFNIPRDGILFVPLYGGKVQNMEIDTSLVPGMDRVTEIAQYEDEAYIIMLDGMEWPPGAFCRWSPESGIATPILETDGQEFAPDDLFIENGIYYITSGSKYISGELPQ